jgi:mannosyltransferase
MTLDGTRLRAVGIGVGFLLMAVGVAMPTGWYVPVVRAGVPDAPFSGLLLVRLVWMLEGLFVLAVVVLRPGPGRLTPAQRWRGGTLPADTMTHATALKWLIGLTAVAALLRLLGVGSDLWLDEIAPVRMYRDMSTVEIVISYIASNNHLLNTLLVRLSTAIMGESELAVRLPAVAFGIASVPATYALARCALDRRASLVAAGLLAVSYHHVWFSQNARGYSPYVLFALLSTLFFVRGLREDRVRDWLIYVGATVLTFASLLVGLFLIAAQMGVAAFILISRRSAGLSTRPLGTRFALVFMGLGLLCLHLYAAVIPQVYALISSVYSDPATGTSLFSFGFLLVLAEGLVGVRGGVAVWALGGVMLLALPIVLSGLGIIIRRNWVVLGILGGAIACQAAVVVARNLAISPRMFVLGLPLATIVFAAGVGVVGTWVAERAPPWLARLPATGLAVTAAALAMAVPLMSYYQVPKQDYRSSLEFLSERAGGGAPVIVVHLMEQGYRYYGEDRGLADRLDLRYARTLADFERVESEAVGAPVFAVTTLHGFLRSQLPEIWDVLMRDFDTVQVFPGTLGDGAIVVWQRRESQREPRGS